MLDNQVFRLRRPAPMPILVPTKARKGQHHMATQKPSWVIDKERAKRQAASETVWLFGLHAVRDALMNPNREKMRLVLTKNALDKRMALRILREICGATLNWRLTVTWPLAAATAAKYFSIMWCIWVPFFSVFRLPERRAEKNQSIRRRNCRKPF